MSFEKKFAKLFFGASKRIEFYGQIGSLMRSGMSKTDAVKMSYDVFSHEGKKKGETTAVILADVLRRMRNGDAFGRAMRPWAPAEDVMVLEAIESSDDFPRYLDEYCEMVRKKRQIRFTILGGMVYPLAMILAVYGLMFYFGKTIIPQVSSLLPVEEWIGSAAFLAFLGHFSENLAIPVALSAVAVSMVIFASLPRWTGFGRKYIDALPVYSTYRMYTGISFMMAVSSLVKGGMPIAKAVERVRPMSSPYVKRRLTMVRSNMLNGDNFGAALHRTGTGWPDPKMNLSIKIFAETQDLSSQLNQLSKDWIERAQKTVAGSMGVARTIAMLLVFGVVIGIVAGMYSLQDQISQKMMAM